MSTHWIRVRFTPDGDPIWSLISEWDILPAGSRLRVPMSRVSHTSDLAKVRRWAKRYSVNDVPVPDERTFVVHYRDGETVHTETVAAIGPTLARLALVAKRKRENASTEILSVEVIA